MFLCKVHYSNNFVPFLMMASQMCVCVYMNIIYIINHGVVNIISSPFYVHHSTKSKVYKMHLLLLYIHLFLPQHSIRVHAKRGKYPVAHLCHIWWCCACSVVVVELCGGGSALLLLFFLVVYTFFGRITS